MFRKKIQELMQSAETGRNIITDGKHQCRYQDLGEIFEAIDSYVSNRDVDIQDCLVLRCGNNLTEALLLLWQLHGSRDCLLLPRALNKEQELFEDDNLPHFCKMKLQVEPDAKDLDIKKPDTYVKVSIHPRYQPEAKTWQQPGYLFLKTSGSTAEPKLVMHSLEKLFVNARECCQRFRIRSGDRLMIPVPIYHMYGLGAGFLPGILMGASLNLLDRTNIIKYLDREQKFKPTVSFLTPTLCEMFLQTRKSDYKHRLVVTAGDRINPFTFKNFDHRFGQLVNLYGSTELGAIATSQLEQTVDIRSDGVIEPMPGVEIRLAGLEENNSSDMGEMICRHENGFLAYLDKRGTKIADDELDDGREAGGKNWFRTKDLGRHIGDRQFKVIGRTGNSVNRSGILVSFSEVESIMEQQISVVTHVVVVTVEEENVRGKKLLACCELSPDKDVEGNELRSRCFEIMPRHMVPDEVRVMTEIPRLPNGKFDRKKLAGIVGL